MWAGSCFAHRCKVTGLNFIFLRVRTQAQTHTWSDGDKHKHKHASNICHLYSTDDKVEPACEWKNLLNTESHHQLMHMCILRFLHSQTAWNLHTDSRSQPDGTCSVCGSWTHLLILTSVHISGWFSWNGDIVVPFFLTHRKLGERERERHTIIRFSLKESEIWLQLLNYTWCSFHYEVANLLTIKKRNESAG